MQLQRSACAVRLAACRSQPRSSGLRPTQLRLPAPFASSPSFPSFNPDSPGTSIDNTSSVTADVVESSSQPQSEAQASTASPPASHADPDQTDPEPWRKEERRAEAMHRLLTRRLRQIRSGSWLHPPPEAAGGGDPGLTGLTGQAAADAAEADRLDAPARTPVVYLLACTAAWVFVQQWWPVLPLVLEHAQHLDLAPLAALALAVPDTPATAAWQLDVMAVSKGSWGSIWTSGFVHSGLISFMLCMASLLEVGALLEGAFGGLVLLLHVAVCALGAALGQMTLQPLLFGIAGPGVSAGLVVSLLVHKARLMRAAGMAYELRITPLSACILLLSPLLALCQPLLGLGGLLGACLGGAVAALTCFVLLHALRYCVFGPAYIAMCALELVFKVLVAIPKAVAMGVTGLVRVAVQLLSLVVSSIRDIK